MSNGYNNTDVTTVIGEEGCQSPITISPYKPIKLIRVVISKGAPGRPGPKGDPGTTVITPKGTLKGVVGRGGLDDPIAGQPIFQSSKLVGLSSDIQIVLAEGFMSSFGNNKSFDFDPSQGIVDLTYGGNIFNEGDTLLINLNQ